MKLLGSILLLVLFLVGPSIQNHLDHEQQHPQVRMPPLITNWWNGNATDTTTPAPASTPVTPATSTRMVEHHHNPSRQISMSFIPYSPNGAPAPSNIPIVHGQVSLVPKNQVDQELGHTLVNQNGLPIQLSDVRIDPSQIRFTVPDLPDSDGAKIIEQIRNQLGSGPITLDELNNRFVTFTADVPGVLINRTMISTINDTTVEENKTTRTTQIRGGGGAPNYGQPQQQQQYSTAYPPITSYPYNPVAPAPSSYADLYKSTEYSYSVPTAPSYQQQPAAQAQAYQPQQQQQASYQQPAAPYQPQKQESYGQQQKQQESYSQQSYQQPQKQESYSQQQKQESYGQQSYQQPQKQQESCTCQQQPQQIKIIKEYIHVCPYPPPAPPASYTPSTPPTPTYQPAAPAQNTYSTPVSSYRSTDGLLGVLSSPYLNNLAGESGGESFDKLASEVAEAQQAGQAALTGGMVDLAAAQRTIQEITAQLGQWQAYANHLKLPALYPSVSAPPGNTYRIQPPTIIYSTSSGPGYSSSGSYSTSSSSTTYPGKVYKYPDGTTTSVTSQNKLPPPTIIYNEPIVYSSSPAVQQVKQYPQQQQQPSNTQYQQSQSTTNYHSQTPTGYTQTKISYSKGNEQTQTKSTYPPKVVQVYSGGSSGGGY